MGLDETKQVLSIDAESREKQGSIVQVDAVAASAPRTVGSRRKVAQFQPFPKLWHLVTIRRLSKRYREAYFKVKIARKA